MSLWLLTFIGLVLLYLIRRRMAPFASGRGDRRPAGPAASTSGAALRWPSLRLRSRTGWSALSDLEEGYGPGQVAVVNCRSTAEQNTLRFSSLKRGSCVDLQLAHGGERACHWACLGEGDCADRCPEGAISMRDGLPLVDAAACTGCGDCVLACPRQVISLIPLEAQVHHACNSALAAERRAEHCGVACADHGACLGTRHLPAGLVYSRDGRRVINFGSSANLLPLLSLCPTHSFVDRIPHRPWFTVNDHCTGCGDCLPLCPAQDCIVITDQPATRLTDLSVLAGPPRMRVRIVPDRCTGCGLCLPACEVLAIRVVGAVGYDLESRRS